MRPARCQACENISIREFAEGREFSDSRCISCAMDSEAPFELERWAWVTRINRTQYSSLELTVCILASAASGMFVGRLLGAFG